MTNLVTYGDGTYTVDKDQKPRYANTGVYTDHSYSVLGVEEEDGVRYIRVRNPWGQSEHGNDGKNDGYFRIKLELFAELYQDVTFVQLPG